MRQKLIFIGLLFCTLFVVPVVSQPTIAQTRGQVQIGNSYIEMDFHTAGSHLTPVRLVNKITHRTYRLSGKVFELRVTFPGLDITPPAKTPLVLTAKDFSLKKVNRSDNGRVEFTMEGQGLRVRLFYEPDKMQPILRTWLTVTDLSGQGPYLEKLTVFDLNFHTDGFYLGGFGQPVYGNDLFFGVEFPAAYGAFESTGRVYGWHYATTVIPGKDGYATYRAVIGASAENRVRTAFMNYIEAIRPQPTKIFSLYNTWYDIRKFNYPALLSTIQQFDTILKQKYKLPLNAFVIDDGWDNVHSMWEIDRTRLPQGFRPLKEQLARMGSHLGLWISPWNGYGQARVERVKWAGQNGYRPSAGHLCLGEDVYFNAFKQKTLQYLKEADLSFYKIDGFLSACNAEDHQHLPGIYSRHQLTERFVDILKALRKEKPDIFIDITVGTWLSPWWLQYADAVWITGADFGHAEDVPAFSERDKAITFRDYTLYKDFVRDRLQFPLANVMTHGIIKGKLNMLGGKDETLQNWTDNAVMYFSRGVMMWELYLSPEVLSRKEWETLAAAMHWAYANESLLKRTRFVGGNPYAREIYGYLHPGNREALLILRNPFVEPQTITLAYEDLFGTANAHDFALEMIYPNYLLESETVKPNQPLRRTLQGYEVQVLRLKAVEDMAPLPAGVYLRPILTQNKKATYEFFYDPDRPPQTRFFSENQLKRLTFNGKKIDREFLNTVLHNAAQRASKKQPLCDLRFTSLGRGKISGSLTLSGEQVLEQGRVGILLDFTSPVDSLEIQLQINDQAASAVIKKGADGLWYWVLIPMEQVKNGINFTIAPPVGKEYPEGSLSLWELGKKPLAKIGLLGIEVKKPVFKNQPVLPIDAGYRRITKLIFKGEL